MKHRDHADSAPPDEPWRPLTENERALLELLLMPSLGATRRVLAQIPHAEARAGCTCGCGTIDLRVEPAVDAIALVAPGAAGMVEADVLDDAGEAIGGLILWVRDGLLEGLEVHTWLDPPLPLPRSESVRPQPSARIDR